MLLVAALLAAFAFSTGARAESYHIICNNGYWYVTNMYGFGYGDRAIPCDEPKPGWIFDWSGASHIKWVYDGDRVVTPYQNPGDTQVRTAIREVQEQGNKRPLVNQPLADGTPYTAFMYTADANNRAVRGADGSCYREQRVSGRWQRSVAYRTDLNNFREACRKASWNAYYRSQRLPLINPADGTFPSGEPPVPGTLKSAAVDGTTLTLTFNENLDTGSKPSPGAFRVTVNAARRNVASGGVAISGKTVRLTLASAVILSDTVKVRYTRPSSRPLRTRAGTVVQNFADQAVTNDTPPPFEWSATLTAKSTQLATAVGCSDTDSDVGKRCSTATTLTSNTFTFRSESYRVVDISYRIIGPSTGSISVTLDKVWPQVFRDTATLQVGMTQLSFSDAQFSGNSRSLGWNVAFSVLSSISVNQQVLLTLTTRPGASGNSEGPMTAESNTEPRLEVDGNAREVFSLPPPLEEGGSIAYVHGDRTIYLTVTGDVDPSYPTVIVSQDVLDRVERITFDLSEVSPEPPPPGLRLEGFAAKIDLGITLGEEETVTVCLPSAGGDIYRYNDEQEEWETLVSWSETVNGEDVACAEAGAVSLTGVFVAEEEGADGAGGGCVIATGSGEGTVRWQGAVFNLLLIISVLLLIPGKSKLNDRYFY